MIRNTKKAFTLVELIVVITILAVLGTIAFISLQGYSGEARDSKRLSDVNNLVKKVNIELSKGTTLASLFSGSTTPTNDLTINGSGSQSRYQWTVNFLTIKENQADFQDKTSTWVIVNYPMSYSIGGTGVNAYKFMQIATFSEAKNSAVVVGNYYKMQSGDSESLIKNGSNFVTNAGNTLPY